MWPTVGSQSNWFRRQISPVLASSTPLPEDEDSKPRQTAPNRPVCWSTSVALAPVPSKQSPTWTTSFRPSETQLILLLTSPYLLVLPLLMGRLVSSLILWYHISKCWRTQMPLFSASWTFWDASSWCLTTRVQAPEYQHPWICRTINIWYTFSCWAPTAHCSTSWPTTASISMSTLWSITWTKGRRLCFWLMAKEASTLTPSTAD